MAEDLKKQLCEQTQELKIATGYDMNAQNSTRPDAFPATHYVLNSENDRSMLSSGSPSLGLDPQLDPILKHVNAMHEQNELVHEN